MILKKDDEDRVYAAHASFLRGIMTPALQTFGARPEIPGVLPYSD